MLRLHVILAIIIPFHLIVESLAYGPIGYIVHRSSGKLVHPLGGSPYPSDDTPLVVYEGGFHERRLLFQFVPHGDGYGYIKHVPSGKYIHPLGGSQHPPNDTPLVLYEGYHRACLFRFDLRNDYIIHKTSGMIWHPYGGSVNPGNDVGVVLHADRHGRSKFYLANAYGKKMYPTIAQMNEENKSTPPPQNNN